MTAPTLSTDRLVLRQLVLDDAAALFHALSDELVMRYWSSGPHKNEQETREYIAWNAETDADHKCWAITTDGDLALGWIMLMPHRKDNFELGYILAREYWGNGYAAEAIKAVLDFAFRQLTARRISADVDPDNKGSVILLEKLGFQLEGHLRAEWETHIGIRDSLIFGMLAKDWSGD
jgi:ribosomal-protein-alanine N-acetyltransferase